MQVQVKRESHNPKAEYNRIDTKFCNGSIDHIPAYGESVVIQFDRLGWGTFYTTEVINRKMTKDGFEIDTKNSTYAFKFGWREE